MVDSLHSEDEFQDALSDVEEELMHKPVISVSLEEVKSSFLQTGELESPSNPAQEDSELAAFKTLPPDLESLSLSSFQTVPTSPIPTPSVEVTIKSSNTIPITSGLTKVISSSDQQQTLF
jgi:hypothetical protein